MLASIFIDEVRVHRYTMGVSTNCGCLINIYLEVMRWVFTGNGT